MNKIFTGIQIHDWDTYTMEHEPIRPIDLMERASKCMVDAINRRWQKDRPVVVFAGPGNNGGDALAVARLLSEGGWTVSAYLFNTSKTLSDECAINAKRLREVRSMKEFVEVTQNFDPPKLDKNILVIDGLFGVGLNKPLGGGYAALAKYINASDATVVSIDIPSGLMTEDNTYNVRANIVMADVTLTLHSLKLSMLFADNQPWLGEIEVIDIGLSKEYEQRTYASDSLVEREDIIKLLQSRDEFSHKGDMGHALLVAGSYGMAGAAVLSAEATLRSGAGKVTVHTPACNREILQIAVPEAVLRIDGDEKYFTESVMSSEYNVMCIGPGLGQQENTAIAMASQMRRGQAPVVLDADALNILSSHRPWLQQLPRDLIMTPHPKELERLLDTACGSDYDRLQKARELSERLGAYIILKGHYSALCTPDGEVFFNTTGNAGMATAGSGDVLSGVVTALLCRGYSRRDACMLGMYIHGLAGDLAVRDLGHESLIARDIIQYLPKAFLELSRKNS